MGTGSVEFRVLGALEARVDGRLVELGGPRPRTVLARLLITPGEVVPVPALVDALWDTDPPATATRQAQNCVSMVRRALIAAGVSEPAEVIVSQASGYRIGEAVRLDTQHVGELRHAAAQARERGDLTTAAAKLREALDVWRGDALSGLRGTALNASAAHWHESRTRLREDLYELELRLGRHREIIGELTALTSAFPFNEGLARLLMTALARSEQSGEALITYSRIRERLNAELGVDPAPELYDLYLAILRGESAGGAPESRDAGRLWAGRRPPPGALTGREDELRELAGLLTDRAGPRLLTLTGPGGVGKTTLALALTGHVAEAYADGVVVAELGSLPGSGTEKQIELIGSRVLTTMDTRPHEGESSLDAVVRALTGRRLLVLDNAEHLIGSCAAFADRVISSSTTVRLLVTSRRSLELPAETVHVLSPLEDAAARRLLLLRARQSGAMTGLDEHPGLVTELCARLAGLPLAIELAAGRLRSMSPSDLLQRIGTAPGLLGRSGQAALPHQRTLTSSIEWSFDLLTGPQQVLLSRMAIFAGAFPLEAAEQVCSGPPLEVSDIAPLIAELADHSLVQVTTASGKSYRLLVPIRERALALADPADEERTRARHLERYASMAKWLATRDVDERDAHIGKFRAEIAEVLSSINWALAAGTPSARRAADGVWTDERTGREPPGRAARAGVGPDTVLKGREPAERSEAIQHGIDLLTDCRTLWEPCGVGFPLACELTERALHRIGELPRPLRAKLHDWAGRVIFHARGDRAAGRRYLARSLELTDHGDPRRVETLDFLSMLLDDDADPQAIDTARETVRAARSMGWTPIVVAALADVATLLTSWGLAAEADPIMEEAFRKIGDRQLLLRRWQARKAQIELFRQGHDEVEDLAAGVLSDEARLIPHNVLFALEARGVSRAIRGEYEAARADLNGALNRMRAEGRVSYRPHFLVGLAFTEYLAGVADEALGQLRQALAESRARADLRSGLTALNLAAAMAVSWGRADAPVIVAHARRCRERTGLPPWPFTAADCASWDTAAGSVRLPAAEDRPALILASLGVVAEAL